MQAGWPSSGQAWSEQASCWLGFFGGSLSSGGFGRALLLQEGSLSNESQILRRVVSTCFREVSGLVLPVQSDVQAGLWQFLRGVEAGADDAIVIDHGTARARIRYGSHALSSTSTGLALPKQLAC